MDETTKRVRFLVDGNDQHTGERYPAGTEIELTRTEDDFQALVTAGVINLIPDSEADSEE